MTLIFDSWMKKFHHKTSMFHAISIAQHKETIIATSVLVYCNMDRSVLIFLHIRRPNPSITNLFTHSFSNRFFITNSKPGVTLPNWH